MANETPVSGSHAGAQPGVGSGAESASPPAAPSPAVPAPSSGRKAAAASSHLPKEPPVSAAAAAGSGGQAADGSAPPAAPPAAPADPPDTTDRLVQLAREQRRLEEKRKKLTEETKADAADAKRWRDLQEAKTSKGRMAALESLFEASEIESDLYTELTERIYAKGDGAGGVTKEDAAKLVATALEKKAADDAAAAKAADEAAQAARSKDQAEVEGGYLAAVQAVFVTDKAKYPALTSILEDFPGAVSGADILKFSADHYAEHKAAPDADTVLGHFEAKLAKRLAPKAEPVPPPKTVSNGWRSDAAPVANGAKRQTPAERWEAQKRAAGIEVK